MRGDHCILTKSQMKIGQLKTTIVETKRHFERIILGRHKQTMVVSNSAFHGPRCLAPSPTEMFELKRTLAGNALLSIPSNRRFSAQPSLHIAPVVFFGDRNQLDAAGFN